jgi:phosphoglycolate phosphatase-like HAD superfamily hydrolase
MPPTFVLFDIDGTLMNTAGAGRRALEAAFHAAHGLGDVATRTARVAFAGKTDPMIIAEMAAALALSPGDAGALERAYLAALVAEMGRPDPRRRVLPGVRALLEALSAREDVHLGLLTGNVEAGARAKLEPFGLNPFFATGGFGSDHGDRREVARCAVARLVAHVGREAAPRRIVVVGDTENDVDCARANGYRAVAVLTGWSTRGSLEASCPDALLQDLSDLPAALRALQPDGVR